MKKIGPYPVTGLLGRGGMGVVYQVRVPGTGRPAALKLLSPNPNLVALWGGDEIERRFLDEAHILAGLNHPNLVEVLDRGSHQGMPYYLMEHFCLDLGLLLGEGPDLEAPTRRISLDAALDYGAQALAGLHVLHDAGLVHRDLKPSNLLISHLGEVKISDLGLARGRSPGAPLTKNLIIGTPFYTAPEQERDPEAVTPASDLFSLGVTILRMVIGLPSVPAKTRPSRINPDLDEAWDDFLARALAKRPEDRFASARDMAAVLDDLARDWQTRKKTACATGHGYGIHGPILAGARRAQPLKARPNQAPEVLKLDSLWRPSPYLQGGFRAISQEQVLSRYSGLVWQRGGSPELLTLGQTSGYLESLGPGWRLPTVDELITLLRPAPRLGDDCLIPIFDPGREWLWSADLCTYTSAWAVNTLQGFVAPQDQTCTCHVRAVRTVDKRLS